MKIEKRREDREEKRRSRRSRRSRREEKIEKIEKIEKRRSRREDRGEKRRQTEDLVFIRFFSGSLGDREGERKSRLKVIRGDSEKINLLDDVENTIGD